MNRCHYCQKFIWFWQERVQIESVEGITVHFDCYIYHEREHVESMDSLEDESMDSLGECESYGSYNDEEDKELL